ncbi:MAG: hypothetical protein LQ343_001091 [Gyalolechia ehrenbergii]|nr:MAG: hypothetical protein LQ343_001091 [Gyalolechia ehrenbergii]
MSRSVADATRFTATSPHAYSKPASILRSAAKTYSPSSFTASGSALPSRKQPPASSSNPYPPQQSGRPPPNETPQQKVARLRALRAAEKLKPLGLWDRTVVRGRRWADIAHRTTVYGLMGASVIAGVITVFSLTDMIIYNRNQRALFYATQESIYTSTLRSAIAAEQEHRPLTPDETSILNREKMVLRAEAQRERLKEIGWAKRIKAYLLGDDVIDADLRALQAGMGGEEGVVKKVGDVVGPERVMQALEEKRREEEKRVEDVHVEEVHAEDGGQLDRMAEEVKVGTEKAKGGWSSWFGGSR